MNSTDIFLIKMNVRYKKYESFIMKLNWYSILIVEKKSRIWTKGIIKSDLYIEKVVWDKVFLFLENLFKVGMFLKSW